METRVWYPVGVQTFSTIVREGYVYVDKTRYICDLLRNKSRQVFLSRPRRFGKSLFLSTLHSFFDGDKELFKGLYIYDQPDIEWEKYPVLHFDLSGSEATDPDKLDAFLMVSCQQYAEKYGLDVEKECQGGIGMLFGALIEKVHEKTGKQVVILKDWKISE